MEAPVVPESGTALGRQSEETARMNRILNLQKHAEEIFGDSEIAKRWFQHPNLATDGQPPITLLGSENGYVRVKTLLDRIDYGVLS